MEFGLIALNLGSGVYRSRVFPTPELPERRSGSRFRRLDELFSGGGFGHFGEAERFHQCLSQCAACEPVTLVADSRP